MAAAAEDTSGPAQWARRRRRRREGKRKRSRRRERERKRAKEGGGGGGGGGGRPPLRWALPWGFPPKRRKGRREGPPSDAPFPPPRGCGAPRPGPPASDPPPGPAMAALEGSSSSSSSIIILDEDEEPPAREEGQAAPQAPDGPPSRPPSRPPSAEAPQAPKQPPAQKAPPPGKDPASLKAENERLFAEFVALCSQHTADHPEVIPYLLGRHQKAEPAFLSSVEFRNILGRCLARVQGRSSKVYVYINELCTIFRAHSQKKKQPPLPAPEVPGPSAAPVTPESPAMATAEGSKRQIRYLENLLRLHEAEIRRLQERELDLEELDNEDSPYMQESRLKRRMVRIFKHLCQLKDCNSRTGRVIEQRIPYRGTRYPEVNRRIERLINRPEAFPDYSDILKAVQKASARHNLGLAKRQMEGMAAEAFREVGNRLQERRHLDLVYNFGSHLTDQYRPNSDPALTDPELSRRLRQNREVALRRLEEVTSHFAQLQEQSEDEGLRRRREARAAGREQAGPSNGPGQQPEGEPPSPQQGSPRLRGRSTGTEEEEEEESSSESDIEAELQKTLKEAEEEEEEEEGDAPDDNPSAPEVEADQSMGLEEAELVPSSSEEELDAEDTGDPQPEGRLGGERGQRVGQAPTSSPPGVGPSPSQQFFLEMEEALTLEAGETPPPTPSPPCQTQGARGNSPVFLSRQKAPQRTPAKRGHVPDDERPLLRGVNGQPSSKLSRRESSSSCIEVPSSGSEEEGEGFLGRPPSSHSPAPLADSTCVDSPGVGLVSSSQGSPLPPQNNRGRLLAAIWKASVATQCDPEEIIVLSDSD